LAKDGSGSATLSMAQAGARFASSLLRALKGESGIIEPCYVHSPVALKDSCEFFATNVQLGKNGVEKIMPVGKLSDFETKIYNDAVVELKGNIKKGVEFANKK
jgi:malate dehydrogenase